MAFLFAVNQTRSMAGEIFIPMENYRPFNSSEFHRVARFVEGRLGIRMPATKQGFLETRLLKRMRALGLYRYDDYAKVLFADEGGEEAVELINAVTTNTTNFYREADHFQQLVRDVLPSLSHRRGEEHRFWSAACSSGEEPYTLAIVLAQYAKTQPDFDFRILATDISRKVLAQAENAVYSDEQIEGIPPELRSSALLRGKAPRSDQYRVRPELRTKIVFRRLNLMDDSYPFQRPFDAVFCRNVLIYFDRTTQVAVLERLCTVLPPGGALFLGHAESITGMKLPLRQVAPSSYRRL